MPFLNTGFILRRILEPNPSDILIEELPGMALLRRIPLFFILEFEKQAC
jgi:hypothetical protein